MCEYNSDCGREPGYVIVNGPDEAVLECCGAVVSPSSVRIPPP
ncbi:hypothetical protein [Halegenticoccus soli]|nr:hypothetical protein [Halegenticoccus soli]